MSILQTIAQWSQQQGFRFLVIGGHAVIAHGYARQTGDLDLLVRKAERQEWKDYLRSQAYDIYHEQEVFTQFNPPGRDQWPLDIMWANDPTFEGMWAEAKDIAIGGVSVKIPCVEHLLALKLHAVKYAMPHRQAKDTLDILHLLKANRIDFRSEKFHKLCEKYGSEQIYEKIVAAESQS